jgi:hypothetical protein
MRQGALHAQRLPGRRRPAADLSTLARSGCWWASSSSLASSAAAFSPSTTSPLCSVALRGSGTCMPLGATRGLASAVHSRPRRSLLYQGEELGPSSLLAGEPVTPTACGLARAAARSFCFALPASICPHYRSASRRRCSAASESLVTGASSGRLARAGLRARPLSSLAFHELSILAALLLRPHRGPWVGCRT